MRYEEKTEPHVCSFLLVCSLSRNTSLQVDFLKTPKLNLDNSNSIENVKKNRQVPTAGKNTVTLCRESFPPSANSQRSLDLSYETYISIDPPRRNKPQ